MSKLILKESEISEIRKMYLIENVSDKKDGTSMRASDPDFWKSNRENWSIVCSAFEEQKDKLDYNNSDLFKAFKFFNQIHD